jgi:hypothetical protein
MVYWTIFAAGVRYFLTDNRFAQFYRFSCAIFRGFKISPWGHVGIVGFVVLKLSYQIFWLSNTFFASSWRGWATIVVILLFMHWAISFHYGSLYPPKQ